MRTNLSLSLALAATVAAATLGPGLAAGQEEKPAEQPPKETAAPPRPVSPPRALGGGRLPAGPQRPPGGPAARPTVGTTDDPAAALVIDGVKVDRATYGEALIAEYGEAFLEPFVANWLFERRAKELGVAVTDTELVAAADKQANELLERRYRGNEDALRAALKSTGLSLESWKDQLKKRMRRTLLETAVVRADRDLSEEALRAEFETRYGPGGQKREGRAILLSTQVWSSNLYTMQDYEKEKPAIEAEAKARAEKVLADLKAGADFATLARERSEDPMAEKGGDYGRFWKNRFGADVDAKLEALAVGQMTDHVLETPRGFIVAKATGTQEGWEFKARHILLSTRVEGLADASLKERKLAEAKAEAEKIIAEIKGGKDFAEIARTRSDDPGSKAKGGDLGTFGAGRMVAPFEKALLELKEDEISGPVESPFGIHVIQLLSKRRKPEEDQKLMSIILCSTEFLKVKERKLKPTLEETAKKLADEIAAKLRAGENAEELARKHSDDATTKEKGGAISEPLGPVFGPKVAEAFAKMEKPGDVAVVQTERGYFVVKLEKLEKHDFATEKDAIAKELREKEPTPAEIRAYREKLRAAANVLKGKF